MVDGPVFGAHLRPLREFVTWEQIQIATTEALHRALDIGNVIAFAGAGLSRDHGFPLWRGLVKDIVAAVRAHTSEQSSDSKSPFNRNPLSEIEGQFLCTMEQADLDKQSAQELTSALDYCQRIFLRRSAVEDFHRLIRAKFREYERDSHTGSGGDTGKEKPVDALIQRLGIRRFITTNYDNKIEMALGKALNSGHAPIGSSAPRPQGTHLSCPTVDRLRAKFSDLVTFALGVGDYEAGVLYLHGRLTSTESEQAGLILTESQYQQSYLSGITAARDHRDAYKLSFNANTILFTGSGLDDDDPLRPMREFVADNDISVATRPWFALKLILKGTPVADQITAFHRLYYRYGIRTIFVEHDQDAEGDALVREITKIQTGWMRYRKARMTPQAVPYTRAPTFGLTVNDSGSSRVVVRHRNDYSDREGRQPEMLHRPDNPRSIALGRRNMRLVMGLQGAGKGRTGLELAMNASGDFPPTESDNYIGFFATTHFANEFLSVIEGARQHLETSCKEFDTTWQTPSSQGRSTISQFFEALRKANAHCTFVFGGVERLLRHVPYSTRATVERTEPLVDDKSAWLMRFRKGRPANPEIEEFLREASRFGLKETGADPGSGDGLTKTVFLTSAVLPSSVVEKMKPEEMEECVLGVDQIFKTVPPPVPSVMRGPEQPAEAKLVSEAIAERLLEIGALLHENLYVRDVIFRSIETVLDTSTMAEVEDWLSGQIHELRGVLFHERPSRVIQNLVTWITYRYRGNAFTDWQREILALVLTLLSLFTTPVECDVLATAITAAVGNPRHREDRPRPSWREILPDFLMDLHRKTQLVLLVTRGEGGEPRFTSHTVIRQAMLQKMGGRAGGTGEIQQFDLHDFASEPGEVQLLDVGGAELTLKVLDALVGEAEKLDGSSAVALESERALIRGAYGILRAGWSATGLGRILNEQMAAGSPSPIYQQYHRRLARLLTIVCRHSGRLDISLAGTSAYSHQSASLYPDELAWLYNELGLVCYAQGTMPDSSTFFRLAQSLSRRIEGERPGYRRIEALINLAVVRIDRAMLPNATDNLTQAAAFAESYGSEAREVMARVRGYMGLVRHLSGDTVKALELYDDAIKSLSDVDAWRGISIFSRHKADLLRGTGDLKNARISLDRAVATAEAGFHPDLRHYCRVSDANLRRLEAREDPTIRNSASALEPTLKFAEGIGSAKLESDVYRVRGLIEVDQRDFDAAMRSTLACLWISGASGLRLRVMSSLELLGLLMKGRGQAADSRSIFRAVIRLGQRFEYQAPMEYADRVLAELNGS